MMLDGDRSFLFHSSSSRVIFGMGSLTKAPEEINRLRAKRVLILTTPGRKKLGEDMATELGAKAVGVFDRAVMHVPAEIAERARGEAARLGADLCVAIGGGSAIGLAKAIAAGASLPILAIPTTYSGSEMTSTWGLTEHGIKKTLRDARVQPQTVIYDPALTLSLPAKLSATSGMNAMAHCVEALYAQDANPITSLLAEEGIRSLTKGLPAVVRDPLDRDARSLTLYGAWLGGMSLGATTTALHHKLCHILGGAFDLPHSETHAVLLPHVTAYNARGAPRAMARIAQALAPEGVAKSAAQLLHDLEASMKTPLSLRSLGMNQDGVDHAAALVMEKPFYNPSALTKEGIRVLLEDAFEGRPPRI
ncbi:MAG TPA: maleylacetate reductase [Candidatus Acidoferrales bacterium]|nr:maleylacetate reductase [Candidatus Acidoferrales bacterium]